VTTDRLSLPALWGRHIELRVPHLLWKLAWLTIFGIAIFVLSALRFRKQLE
jgi:hypothetical protein